MGFKTFQQQNITVGVGQSTRVDAQLTPGQVTQTVEVTAAAPMLDATSAVVSGTLNTQTIVDLPLNGRNFQDLLAFRPGVAAQPGGGSLTVSVNGIDPSNNNNYVEGLDNNEPFSGDSLTNQVAIFGDAATFLPIDAIQELNIEDNAPAEFGRKRRRHQHRHQDRHEHDSRLGLCLWPRWRLGRHRLRKPSHNCPADATGAVGRNVRRTHHQEQAVLFRRLRAAVL